jgi:hypothetical protein
MTTIDDNCDNDYDRGGPRTTEIRTSTLRMARTVTDDGGEDDADDDDATADDDETRPEDQGY